MTKERYIAAIEISSSRISGAVGRALEGGQIDILAVESERTEESVRYGVIQNPEEAALRLRRVIDKLQSKPEVSPRKIMGVYTGLSGRSVKSITTHVDIHLSEETEITEDIIDRLRDKALNTIVDNSLEVIDAVPRSFKIGKIETLAPKGSIGQDISATYDLIVSRPELRRNINRTLPEKLGIRNEGFVVTPLACGHLLLSNDEKRLGCMLADLGAETTTVSIYKDGHLRFFATIPLGGRNITRDLTNLNLLEENAEQIKITSGNAIASATASQININGVKHSDVSNIIVARAEEIVANIVATIEYAGLEEKDLPGGIVCIGGGSKLNGMLELISNKCDLPVRRGQLPPFIHVEEMKQSTFDLLSLACILYEGATLNDAEGLEMPKREELPANGEEPFDDENEAEVPERPRKQRSGNRLFDKIRTGLSNYFSPDKEEDSDLF